MKAVFLSPALAEMAEAAQFYESQQAGLGHRFLDAIDRAIEEIEKNPQRWPILKKQIRRRLVGRFPYGILYRMDRQEITIVAIMHLHRRPNYWTKRI
ncbi:MAG: type II toxin-antitoxin system RelE/ParE family toxin [Phycisphaerales bacterium]|nr:type II toxin-antitoxin system RelE/ParE family toxin [Phycisphaerales bacterium]